MDPKPADFSQLIHRLMPIPSRPIKSHGPLIASVTETADLPPKRTAPLWVILHSITESDVRLIHSRPLSGNRLTVQIAATSGEILRVQLAMSGSQKNGELYETTAEFLS